MHQICRKAYSTIVLAIAVVACRGTAGAIEYPITPAVAASAIAYGKSTSSVDIATNPVYLTTANGQTWANYSPSCHLITPYSLIALAAATDITAYTNKAKKIAAEMIRQKWHTFQVSFKNYSAELGANKDAVGVIHQNGKVIKALSRSLRPEEVGSDPIGEGNAGYYQYVTFTFDLRAINPRKPFSVGLANVLTVDAASRSVAVGEVTCDFDASAK